MLEIIRNKDTADSRALSRRMIALAEGASAPAAAFAEGDVKTRHRDHEWCRCSMCFRAGLGASPRRSGAQRRQKITSEGISGPRCSLERNPFAVTTSRQNDRGCTAVVCWSYSTRDPVLS